MAQPLWIWQWGEKKAKGWENAWEIGCRKILWSSMDFRVCTTEKPGGFGKQHPGVGTHFVELINSLVKSLIN